MVQRIRLARSSVAWRCLTLISLTPLLTPFLTHSLPPRQEYKLVVDQVFSIRRHNEQASYEEALKRNTRLYSNRKLLWHGSRLTNFVGIISQGLRIAPKEAPSTGYMFGKGV